MTDNDDDLKRDAIALACSELAKIKAALDNVCDARERELWRKTASERDYALEQLEAIKAELARMDARQLELETNYKEASRERDAVVEKLKREVESHAAQETSAQAFFANYATECRRPSFGEHARAWVREMLLRAEEAGLYRP